MKVAAVGEQDGAILAALHHQCARPHVQNAGGGAPQVVLAGEHARLAVVDQQEVPIAHGLQQFRAIVANPVIHGVAARELQAVHLRAHVALQRRLDIAQQQIGRRAVRYRQLGLEIGEHVEVRAQVSRSFMSAEYLPSQKKVLPGTRSRPSRSIPLAASRATSSRAKSSPTTATILTGVK
jgi:hypothetical protein